MINAKRIWVLLLFVLPAALHTQSRGTLIVMGGGPWHDEVQKRFVELAGGGNGTILVLPMASASSDSGKSSVEGWKEYGTNARALVVNRDEAMRADTAALFKGVTGIWFGGGDQSRLTAAICVSSICKSRCCVRVASSMKSTTVGRSTAWAMRTPPIT